MNSYRFEIRHTAPGSVSGVARFAQGHEHRGVASDPLSGSGGSFGSEPLNRSRFGCRPGRVTGCLGLFDRPADLFSPGLVSVCGTLHVGLQVPFSPILPIISNPTCEPARIWLPSACCPDVTNPGTRNRFLDECRGKPIQATATALEIHGMNVAEPVAKNCCLRVENRSLVIRPGSQPLGHVQTDSPYRIVIVSNDVVPPLIGISRLIVLPVVVNLIQGCRIQAQVCYRPLLNQPWQPCCELSGRTSVTDVIDPKSNQVG